MTSKIKLNLFVGLGVDGGQAARVAAHTVPVPLTKSTINTCSSSHCPSPPHTSNSIAGIRRYKYWPTICTPRILLFRSEIQSTDTQIKYKPPIVTTRLNRLSYFVVYIFQSLFTFFNICTQIFTLSR